MMQSTPSPQEQDFQKKIYPRFYNQLPIWLTTALAIGIWLGATIFGKFSSNSTEVAEARKYREILRHIQENYVDPIDIEQLHEQSIHGLLEQLDPHTSYIPASDVVMAKSHLEGGFEGIGVEFVKIRDSVFVVNTVPKGPSQKAGILPGDRIVSVNGELVSGVNMESSSLFKKLRGQKGTKVKLEVIRSGKMIPITVARDQIQVPSVESFMINAHTGYIKIIRFAQNTHQEFIEVVRKFNKNKIEQLVIDLRDNPGGYMEQAVKIVDELLSGQVLIVRTNGKNKRYNTEDKAENAGLFEKGAVVLLIDEGSASASEIMAGALQDHDRALIVGRRSYGKGLVQMPIKLSDGSELRLTISRYYTPSGRSIQRDYKDPKKYADDLANRYKSGELFHADSIHASLGEVFNTSKGRRVYGGGGISPDYFIPLDTSQITNYFTKLDANGLLVEFATDYYLAHVQKLQQMTLQDFKRSFEITTTMLDQLIDRAKKEDIPFEQEGFEKAKHLITDRLKAYIGRLIWQNEAYYPSLFEHDATYLKALELLPQARKL